MENISQFDFTSSTLYTITFSHLKMEKDSVKTHKCDECQVKEKGLTLDKLVEMIFLPRVLFSIVSSYFHDSCICNQYYWCDERSYYLHW